MDLYHMVDSAKIDAEWLDDWRKYREAHWREKRNKWRKIWGGLFHATSICIRSLHIT